MDRTASSGAKFPEISEARKKQRKKRAFPGKFGNNGKTAPTDIIQAVFHLFARACYNIMLIFCMFSAVWIILVAFECSFDNNEIKQCP